MSTFIKNPDGSQTEVFTAEEVEAKAKEAADAATRTATDAATKAAEEAAEKRIEEFKKSNPDQTEELDKLKDQLAEANAKLEAAGGKEDEEDGESGQVKRLREERDEARRALDEKMGDFEKGLESVKSARTGDIKTELLNKFAGDDKELREKIEVHFDSFVGDAITREEIQQRMENAVLLATGKPASPGVLDNIASSSSKGEDTGTQKTHEPTENEKAIGTVLGVSEEDRKKYGPGGEKDPNKSNQ